MRFAPFVLALLFASAATADSVVTRDRVVNGVRIRAQATSNSQQVGSLRPGEAADHLGSVPRWHRVRLANGVEGFVSKSFTLVVPDAAAPGGLPARAQDELRIHYLAVGAGTCTVVECPGNNAPPMIIDCGSRGTGGLGLTSTQAQTRIAGILANHNTDPNLVLSHGDTDHYNYIDTVFAGVQLDHIWQGGDSTDYNAALQAFLIAQDNSGATLHQDLVADFHNNEFSLGLELDCGDADAFVLTVNSGT